MSLIVSSDEHTITIKVPEAVTQEQVCSALQSAFDAAAKLDSANRTGYRLNMVEKKGNRTGRGFVYIFNPRVYHMLLGNNPDGSSRTRRYPDPSWAEPSMEQIMEGTYYSGQSWIDILEDEESLQPPMIEEVLPPLITIPSITLSPQQRETVENKPDQISIRLEAALAHDVAVGFDHYVLRSSNLLPHMDEKFIKNEFSCFSTSSATYSTRVGKGKNGLVQESYPIVKIKTHSTPRGSERIAYVNFDASTRDASFAFHMMRCRKYFNHKTNQSFIVSYTYAKTQRA